MNLRALPGGFLYSFRPPGSFPAHSAAGQSARVREAAPVPALAGAAAFPPDLLKEQDLESAALPASALLEARDPGGHF